MTTRAYCMASKNLRLGVAMFLAHGGHLRLEPSFYAASVIEDVICIVDLGGADTWPVTNNIEEVCHEVTKKFGASKPVIYCDSESVWDQVLVDFKGDFVDFKSVAFRDRRAAIEFARRRDP